MPLYALSLLYLYLPLGLFACGWLAPQVGLPLVGLLVGAAWRRRAALCDRQPIGRKAWLAALVLALAWTACVGAGGIGYPNGDDWRKHNAVLKDLINKDWPVRYDYAVPGVAGEQHQLVYYFAYHLPAAALGKLAGWRTANLALFFWTLAGTFLVLLWVQRLVDFRPLIAVAIFVFASGMDAVGILMRSHRIFALSEHIEWWAVVWHYSSNTELLFWAPHQALGAWLATAMLVDGQLDVHRRVRAGEGALLESFGALLWSPLACIGLVPFVLLRLARAPREWLRAWPTWTCFPLLAAVLFAYFSAMRVSLLPTLMVDEIFGPLAGLYLLFVAIEFAPFWWLARPAGGQAWSGLWWVAGPSLVVIPFVHYSVFNDFSMRVSIPALFVLWILVERRLLVVSGADRLRRAVLAGLVTLGSLTAVSEMARAVTHFRMHPAREKRVPEVPLVHERAELNTTFLGDPESFFFRYLSRRSSGSVAPP